MSITVTITKKYREGEVGYNTYGTEMKIIKYNVASDILVEFQDEHRIIVKTNYQAFKKGEIRNPYDKTKYGIGYLGVGKYNSRNNGKLNKIYNTWRCMFERCYSKHYQEKEPTYRGCTVCNEWHNYQNFAKWYEDNYYEIEGERMCLDKDILVKGNKVYSPETCVFVPNIINLMFAKNNARRGSNPIGVSKRGNKFAARCCVFDNGNKWVWLGVFDNPSFAFKQYKNFKEKYIKEVADKYIEHIPTRLYNALYSYEVHDTD